MKEKIIITASIVLYNEEINALSKTIDSFLKISLPKKLYLIDNSSTDKMGNKFDNKDIDYIFNGKNIGFGAAHNIVINKIIKNSKYHLILNPDVSFDEKVISTLIEEVDKYDDVALIAPKVVFPNGEHQYTCRKHPKLIEIISRHLGIFKKYVHAREYRKLDLTRSFYPDFIHGCFQLYKTADFIKLRGFDERYFLYMEDADICRKIDTAGKKKMYHPKVVITHSLQKASSKNIKLFIIHFNSAMKYFFKWGF